MNQPQTILIAGSGRSGTTWVLDVISATYNLKTVFEPLHPCVGKTTALYADQYLAKDTEHPVLEKFFDDVFSGRIHSLWTDHRIVPSRLIPRFASTNLRHDFAELIHRYKRLWGAMSAPEKTNYAGLSIKFIRANLMLEWIACKFNLPILYVIRHPCAVAESKIRSMVRASLRGAKHGLEEWEPRPLLQKYLDNQDFRARHIAPYVGDIDVNTLSDITAHSMLWCLQNVPVLNRTTESRITVVCYEHLADDGLETWRRVCSDLGFATEFNSPLLEKPSQQASFDFKHNSSKANVSSRWIERMSDAEIHAVGEVLEKFGVTLYDAGAPLPRLTSDEVSNMKITST